MPAGYQRQPLLRDDLVAIDRQALDTESHLPQQARASIQAGQAQLEHAVLLVPVHARLDLDFRAVPGELIAQDEERVFVTKKGLDHHAHAAVFDHAHRGQRGQLDRRQPGAAARREEAELTARLAEAPHRHAPRVGQIVQHQRAQAPRLEIVHAAHAVGIQQAGAQVDLGLHLPVVEAQDVTGGLDGHRAGRDTLQAAVEAVHLGGLQAGLEDDPLAPVQVQAAQLLLELGGQGRFPL